MIKNIPLTLVLLVSVLAAALSCGLKSAKSANPQENMKESMKRVTLPSGLQYEILKESSHGQAPQKGQIVTAHYTGWLADENGNKIESKKFDSSVDRGTPFKFVIGRGQVIAGWDEGIALMKVGEQRRLIIPAHLGYGARGAGASIPGNATLVFDVELLNIG
jgi:peptidylprolyl isomerase